jgi:hypothetical protein
MSLVDHMLDLYQLLYTAVARATVDYNKEFNASEIINNIMKIWALVSIKIK